MGIHLWEPYLADRRRLAPYGCVVTEEDRDHWDERYRRTGRASVDEAGPPPMWAPYEHLFPTAGQAMEVACGRGRGALWLAGRGLSYWGFDVSPVAVGLARDLARRRGVGDRCRFDVVDLDDGLPEGPPVDVVLCHFFRDPRLDRAIIERLAPGGLLAIAVCSEVDVGPGPFRAGPSCMRLSPTWRWWPKPNEAAKPGSWQEPDAHRPAGRCVLRTVRAGGGASPVPIGSAWGEDDSGR